ncbi:hypothetical protein [Flexivirga caeni]|nr:hypothetical protein [Flexivirga caeni]
MVDTSTARPLEHDGKLWKPQPDATSSADEFIAARALFIEISEDSLWNPWVRNERRDELETAMAVMAQWTRAEPGHRMMTMKQWDARQARRDKASARQRERDKERRERDKERHDPERAAARLVLLEFESRLAFELAELTAFRDGVRYPAMPADRREDEIAKLVESVDRLQGEVDRLLPIVGDREDVVDDHGWLPRDRRDLTFWRYRWDREREVRDLKDKVAKQEAALMASTDKAERRKVRDKLRELTYDLNARIAEGPFTVDEMCSECPTPLAHHGWVYPPGLPCPAWPRWAARVRAVRADMEAMLSKRAAEATEPPPPQPLAVIPSGRTIGEIIAKLAELQREFPTAEVRRGRSNRWELWPPKDDNASAGREDN